MTNGDQWRYVHALSRLIILLSEFLAKFMKIIARSIVAQYLMHLIRQYRNVLSPPFHFDAVKQWIPHFHQLTKELMQHWTPLVDNNESVDIVRWMPLFTLDVLGTTVLSRSFNAMKGKEDKELAALANLLQTGVRPSTMILAVVRI